MGPLAEVDLEKPLMTGYRMWGEYYRLQYEGLHDLCFGCGRYGQCDATCLEKVTSQRSGSGAEASNNTEVPQTENQVSTQAACGEWTTIQHSRRRGPTA